MVAACMLGGGWGDAGVTALEEEALAKAGCVGEPACLRREVAEVKECIMLNTPAAGSEPPCMLGRAGDPEAVPAVAEGGAGLAAGRAGAAVVVRMEKVERVPTVMPFPRLPPAVVVGRDRMKSASGSAVYAAGVCRRCQEEQHAASGIRSGTGDRCGKDGGGGGG